MDYHVGLIYKKMKTKRTVFLIDSSKKEEVKQWLDRNGIVWATEARFRFDLNTAVVVAGITLTMGLIVLAIVL